MAVVRVLDDLLKDPLARKQSYSRLVRELRGYIPTVDAKFLSWHLTIPQKIAMIYDAPPKTIFPQYDSATCKYCDTTLLIPLETPRFNPETLYAYRSFKYTPSPPQVCSCENLKTITDHSGNATIYLEDDDIHAFRYYSGPINLRESRGADIQADINSLLHTPRPTTNDPFNLELRRNVNVNHVNLYRCSQHTINTLLPYEDLKAYARCYNIVLYLKSTIIFPTGHEFAYKVFKNISFKPFSNPLVTIRSAEVLNKLTYELYHTHLPDAIVESFDKRTRFLSKRLKIKHSYAPSYPYIPFIQRMGLAWTDKQNPNAIPKVTHRPLMLYPELTVLRLTYFNKSSRFHQYHKQDFKHFHQRNDRILPPTRSKITQHKLIYLKRERRKLLLYILPRFQQSSIVSFRNTIHTVTHNGIPHTTPHNHTLLQLTTL